MTVTQYVWDQDNILYETDGNDAVNAEYTYSPEQYGELISEYRGGETYTHYYDAQGSTLAMTDEAGHVTDRFTYNAWGEEVVRTGITTTPWRWIGASGYYFNSADLGYAIRRRRYSPSTMRWLSCDALLFADGLNMFLYACNNPVLALDPSGLCRVCFSGIKYRVAIKDLDSYTRNQSYQRLAEFARSRYRNEAYHFYGFDVPKLETAGPFSQLNKQNGHISAGSKKLAFFLFFVSWDICETADDPCRIFLDETGTTVRYFSVTSNNPNGKTILRGNDRGELKKDDGDWTIDDRVPPIDNCDKKLIYVDAPGYVANLKTLRLTGPEENYLKGGFKIDVKQVLKVKNKNDDVLNTVQHSVRVEVTKDGEETFFP